MRFYWLRYLTFLASFIDSLCGIITLGFYAPYLSLIANIKFMDYCDKNLEYSYKHIREKYNETNEEDKSDEVTGDFE